MTLQLSAYDLHHLTQDLQVLVGGKIEKIFQQEKPHQDILISVHKSGEVKQYLYVSLPGIVCLSNFKPSFPSIPPAFCSSLRRKITNTKITSITQHEFQRILIIELMGKFGKSTLVIELFSQGNIILLDDQDTIIAVLHRKIWNEERKILHNQKYVLPSQEINIKNISLVDFSTILKNSTKETIVTFLAIECGLGGTYAEHILNNAGMDKETNPSVFSQTEELFEEVQKFLNLPTEATLSRQNMYAVAIKEGQTFSSLSELISSQVLEQLQGKEEKEQNKEKKEALTKFEKVVKSQEKQYKGLIKSSQENQLAGELIYNHYQDLKDLLELLTSNLSWDEKKDQVKKYGFVLKIDEKKREVQVELE